MIQAKMPHHLLWRLTRRLLIFVPLLGMGGCIENTTLNQTYSDIGAQIFVGGSVGDGPIVGSTIVVHDAHGRLILSGKSTEQANYALKLPMSTKYPITVSSNGGIDLVTGIAPTFEMSATISERSANVININPFSTLIMETAAAMPGGLNAANIALANRIVMSQLNFGIDNQSIPNIVTTPVTSNNVAIVVKSSEALAEMLRRTSAAARASGIDKSDDDIIRSIADDLIDGILDGSGAASADPLIALLANISSAQVLIESISNNLYVNGVWAIQLMDNAMRITHPRVFAQTADAPLTTTMLDRLSIIMNAIQTTASQFNVQSIIDALPQISIANPASDAAQVLPADKGAILNEVKQYFSSNTAGGWSAFNAVIRQTAAIEPAIMMLRTGTPNINPGNDVLLVWAGAYTRDCMASGDWTGAKAAFGTQIIKNITVDSNYTITCSDANGGTVSSTVRITVQDSTPSQKNIGTKNPASPLIANTIRINAGGPKYIDNTGKLWAADTGYNIGNAAQWSLPRIGNTIANTTEPELYRTERWIGASMPYLEYGIDVPNGQYRVTLHFVDHVYSTAGKRVTRILAEGHATILSFDVADEVGIHAALSKQFSVDVVDGQLNIRLERILDNPNVAAIEVENIDPTVINERNLTLKWKVANEPLTGYQIYTAPTASGRYTRYGVINIDPNWMNTGIASYTFSSWKDLALIKGDEVCFKLRAFNSAGLSSWSEPVCTSI